MLIRVRYVSYNLAQIAGSLVDTYAGPIAIKALHWKVRPALYV